jgi:hypothetical protein
MEKIEQFFSFEEKLHPDKIRSSRFSLWYFWRIYIASQLTFGYDRSVKPDSSHLSKLFQHFFRGFGCWFKRFDIVILSSSDQRRLMNGRYTDRMDICYPDRYKKLFLELPAPSHYSKSTTASANLISRLHLYALEWLLIKIHPSIRLDGVQEMEAAIKMGAEINTQHLAKRFHVQYKVFKHLLKRWRPKLVVVVNSYTNMAYVKAAKDLGIPVVELQHGVINEKHYAYQIRFKPERSYYPDYLLSFGMQEKNVFSGKNNFIDANKVIPIGSFYLDYLAKNPNKYKELEDKGKFRLRVCISGQVAFEEKMLDFVAALAPLCPDILFAYVPRQMNTKLEEFKWPKNACLIRELNVYECISACDVHSTINSTCAIEALSLGTTNILMDIDGRAKAYFMELLGQQGYTHFASNPTEFAGILRSLASPDREKIKRSNEQLIVNNFSGRIDAAISFILDKNERNQA